MKKISVLILALLACTNLLAQQQTTSPPDQPPVQDMVENDPATKAPLRPGDIRLFEDAKFPEISNYKVQMLVGKQWRDTSTAVMQTFLSKDKSKLWQLFTTTLADTKITDSSLVSVKDFNALYFSSTSKQNSMYVNFVNSKISGSIINAGKKELIDKTTTSNFFNPMTFNLLFANCNNIDQLEGKTISVFDESSKTVMNYTIMGIKTEMLATNPEIKNYVISISGASQSLTYFIDGETKTTTRFEVKKDGKTVGYSLSKK